MRLPEPPPWRGLCERLTWDGEKRRLARLVGYEPHEGQLSVHQSRRRFRVICNGRRFGKSVCASFEATCVGVLGGYVTCVAPTQDLASIVWSMAVDRLYKSPLRHLVSGLREAAGRQVVVFASGGIIDARSSDNPKSLLGRGRDMFVFDECAQEEDPEVYHQYMRPSLSDREGGLLAISTPRGEDWFQALWERGYVGTPGYRSWQLPTSANPYISASEIADLIRDMSESDVQQEIYAQFLASQGAVFRGYRDAATAEWQDRPIPGHQYVIGVDLAQERDWTVIAVFDVTLRQVAHIVRFNQLDWAVQEAAIREQILRWQAPALIDQTNNMSAVEHVRDELPDTSMAAGFTFTSLSKREIINRLALDIGKNEIGLLNDQTEIGRMQLTEFGAYRYKRMPSGILQTNAPAGKHDDIVIAVGLALRMADRVAGQMAPYTISGATGAPPSIRGTFVQPAPKKNGSRFGRS